MNDSIVSSAPWRDSQLLSLKSATLRNLSALASAAAMPPALPASSPPPNWVESNHPLGWLIDRLLAVGRLRRLRFWKARRLFIRTAEGRGIVGASGVSGCNGPPSRCWPLPPTRRRPW